MFETSLVGRERRRSPQRWLALPIAVALHLVVLTSLVFAQYWSIEPVSDPQVIEAFQVMLPPPAAPAERGTQASRPTVRPPVPRTAPERPQQPVPPQPPAPPTTPSDQPVPPPAPAETATSGDPQGVEHGDPHGRGHGSPFGIPGGIDDGPGLPQPGLPGDSAPIPYRSEMTRPRILYEVRPEYTEIARHARLQGTVILEAVIDESGRVLDVHILKRLPMGLDRAAADAVAQWRFSPATLNGRPLKVFYTLTVNFTVQ